VWVGCLAGSGPVSAECAPRIGRSGLAVSSAGASAARKRQLR
jgi:hypothetical protein